MHRFLSWIRTKGFASAVVGAALGALIAEALLWAAQGRFSYIGRPLAIALLPVGPAVGVYAALKRKGHSRAILTSVIVWLPFIWSGPLSSWSAAYDSAWGLLFVPLAAGAVAVVGRLVGLAVDRATKDSRQVLHPNPKRAEWIWGVILVAVALLAFVPLFLIQRLLFSEWEKERAQPTILEPADWVICRDTLTANCIATATSRSGGPIAYVPSYPDYRLVDLAAPEQTKDFDPNNPIALQHLIAEQGPPYSIEVVTGGTTDENGLQYPTEDRTFDVDGTTVHVRIEYPEVLPFGYVEWDRNGTHFHISKSNFALGGSVTEEDLLDLYRHVRYSAVETAPTT